MGSSRLPGKVMKRVNGIPILGYLIERLKAVKSIDEIVIATTTNPLDSEVEEFARTSHVQCFRGSETNVLERVMHAASMLDATTIVQITGDCPLIDPDIIEQVIQMYYANKTDYMTNSVIRSYPDGMDVQVFSLSSLHRSYQMTSDPLDLEHVSRYMYKNPHIFTISHLIAPPSLFYPKLALTLDEPEDLELIRELITQLYPINPLFDCKSIIDYIRNTYNMKPPNSAVSRKGCD